MSKFSDLKILVYHIRMYNITKFKKWFLRLWKGIYWSKCHLKTLKGLAVAEKRNGL